MEERILSIDDILNIGLDELPMIVLSDNMRSYISYRIKSHEKGCYNHLMWMHRPGWLVSQDWTFKEVSIMKYLNGAHRLKFWTGKHWTTIHRGIIKRMILDDLGEPWYSRLYDPLQIIGKYTGLDWLQIPGLDICSDKGRYLKELDGRFGLGHPSPTETNMWLKGYPESYACYGRYFPD